MYHQGTALAVPPEMRVRRRGCTYDAATMSPLLALAVSVGVLAVVATWLFGLDPLVTAKLQVWQAFIAWGCHYHSGGKFTGTRNTILCMSFGAVVGMLAVML